MPLDPDAIDPVDRHVGARVREERTAAGVTQSQLGEAIGVTFQQVQKYERGTNRISASMLVRVANTLNVPLVSLFPGQGNQAGPVETIATMKGGRQLAEAFVAMSPRQREALLAVATEFTRSEAGTERPVAVVRSAAEG
ncbi:helix-turn-helix domain-containing protein [Brevundimonas kwangchunensis]|uniref:Helix-turn-helix domain-containing protein n=1 Tax=Brevundimonas kwangchunensis TaxID=322163 RepID=A0ABN1H5I3_9CAUL